MKNSGDKIFESELKIYEDAEEYIHKGSFSMAQLISQYKLLNQNYGKLLNIFKKICSISDSQGRELKRRENDIKNLLDNSNQGFLTFGKDLLVDREYSAECLRIFNRKIANVSILELLSSDSEEQNKLISEGLIGAFNEKDKEMKLSYLSSLPQIIRIRNEYININYKIVNTHEYDKKDETIMMILTDTSERRKIESEILYLSYHDKLTSLFNRAYVESILPNLNTTANLPISIIMADLNALKLANDVFGHNNGDKLIINAAKVFSNCCRKSDIIARWGGDEFLIILPGANHVECVKICERIKETCSTIPPDPISLSISLGTATSDTLIDIMSLMTVAENMMYSNKLIESNAIRKEIIFSIEKMLNSKFPEYIGHVERVETIAEKFLIKLNYQPDSKVMSNLILLAQLHDIGKIAIPAKILNKKEKLSEEERYILQKHTEIGYRMAQSIEQPVVAQAILAIREHWDGKGYPYGLKGEDIPIISRILAIIEAYDVMTFDQPYKNKISHEKAVIELEKCSGSQFDPKLVQVFLDNCKKWYSE